MAREIIIQEQDDFPKLAWHELSPLTRQHPLFLLEDCAESFPFPFSGMDTSSHSIRRSKAIAPNAGYFPKKPINDGNDADPAIEGLQHELH